jgi:hypothetical protein
LLELENNLIFVSIAAYRDLQLGSHHRGLPRQSATLRICGLASAGSTVWASCRLKYEGADQKRLVATERVKAGPDTRSRSGSIEAIHQIYIRPGHRARTQS